MAVVHHDWSPCLKGPPSDRVVERARQQVLIIYRYAHCIHRSSVPDQLKLIGITLRRRLTCLALLHLFLLAVNLLCLGDLLLLGLRHFALLVLSEYLDDITYLFLNDLVDGQDVLRLLAQHEHLDRAILKAKRHGGA